VVHPHGSSTGKLDERTIEECEREVMLGEIRRTNFIMTNGPALWAWSAAICKQCQQLGIDLQSIRKTDKNQSRHV